MDNNMNSILSLLMIGVGFINGLVWGSVIKTIDNHKIKEQLHSERVSRIEAELENENLELKIQLLEDVLEEKERKLQKIEAVLNNKLPPPSTPIARLTQVMDEEDESPLITPTTPSVLSNMD
jgi:hypothetical protein